MWRLCKLKRYSLCFTGCFRDKINTFLNPLLVMILQRLQARKSMQTPKLFTVFLARIMCKGPNAVQVLLNAFETIQPG